MNNLVEKLVIARNALDDAINLLKENELVVKHTCTLQHEYCEHQKFDDNILLCTWG